MISTIFENLTEVGEGFTSFLVGLFNALTEIFYTPAVGETPGSFTFFGTLILIGLAVGVTFTVFNFIRNAVNLR